MGHNECHIKGLSFYLIHTSLIGKLNICCKHTSFGMLEPQIQISSGFMQQPEILSVPGIFSI